MQFYPINLNHCITVLSEYAENINSCPPKDVQEVIIISMLCCHSFIHQELIEQGYGRQNSNKSQRGDAYHHPSLVNIF